MVILGIVQQQFLLPRPMPKQLLQEGCERLGIEARREGVNEPSIAQANGLEAGEMVLPVFVC